MKSDVLMAAAMAVAMMVMTVSLFAAEQPAPASRKSEPIYGYGMMSSQERNDYREHMRNARSADERQKIRDEHHKLMQERAKERGVTLSERGQGKGHGYGAGGQGKGQGMGMGPGPRQQ